MSKRSSPFLYSEFAMNTGQDLLEIQYTPVGKMGMRNKIRLVPIHP